MARCEDPSTQRHVRHMRDLSHNHCRAHTVHGIPLFEAVMSVTEMLSTMSVQMCTMMWGAPRQLC